MALPESLTTVPVHMNILTPEGNGATGSVVFIIPVPLRDAVSNTVIGPGKITALLENGEATVNLPATDDPDITPQGWTYKVDVRTDSWVEVFHISVPSSTVGQLELASVAPTQEVKSGQSFLPLTGGNISGTLTFTDATLYRSEPNVLKTDDVLHIGDAAVLRIGSDGNIYRSGVNKLGTDNSFDVSGTLTSFGGVALPNSATPATPADGGILFVQGNALKYIDSLGTITTIAP